MPARCARATSSAPPRAPGTCSPRPGTLSARTSARWAWSRHALPDNMGGLYLGVDIRTSATPVSLIGDVGTAPGDGGTAAGDGGTAAGDGGVRAGDGGALVASAGYPTRRGGDGQVEQDPRAWSRALATALRRTGADLLR